MTYVTYVKYVTYVTYVTYMTYVKYVTYMTYVTTIRIKNYNKKQLCFDINQNNTFQLSHWCFRFKITLVLKSQGKFYKADRTARLKKQ